MDAEYAIDAKGLEDIARSREGKNIHDTILEYLEGRWTGRMLDVGPRNPLTTKLEQKLYCTVYNTEGDLDDPHFYVPNYLYDTILVSHVIEHLHNPLQFLKRLRLFLKNGGGLLIATPLGHQIWKMWEDGHYHEIDERRMRKMLRQSGFDVVNVVKHKRYRGNLKGIRPLIRWLTDKNVIYECRKNNEV